MENSTEVKTIDVKITSLGEATKLTLGDYGSALEGRYRKQSRRDAEY